MSTVGQLRRAVEIAVAGNHNLLLIGPPGTAKSELARRLHRAFDGAYAASFLHAVRTNLETLVGGATEETIIARVGEGIVTTIGSAPSHKKVLENPDSISKVVLARGLRLLDVPAKQWWWYQAVGPLRRYV